jgi:SAM-dependent methyltransferase
MTNANFDSTEYWRGRYEAANNPGSGSRGHLATYKASFVNKFIALNNVASVIDFGCGDGAQLALLDPPVYIGLDVSDIALARCRRATEGREGLSFQNIGNLDRLARCDLSMSLDVLYHLVEDRVFETYVRNLFLFARKFCIIYSSNGGGRWTAAHVRHRVFTDFIASALPEWRLAAHVPNAYPFLESDKDNTSFADFFVYAAEGLECVISSPGRQ